MYFLPTEASANRVDEVPFVNGSFIIDVDDNEILYDTKSGKRIRLIDTIFFNTKEELLKNTGMKNKLYIARDVGQIYVWNDKWIPIRTPGNKIIEMY